MSKSSNLGKPLSGVSSLGSSLSSSVADSIASSINSGALVFNNITITGGTIDGTILGINNPITINATTITSGSSGVGYSVCFYGNTVGDSACWLPSAGQWNIQGDLLVRDIADLGFLRLSDNTIRSTILNGNINLYPNGTGLISISSGIFQSTNIGDLTFQTSDGRYTLTTTKKNTFTSGLNTEIYTNNGDIKLTPGLSIPISNISLISTGVGSVTVTTNSAHGLNAGDIITIASSNSTPNINGVYTITSIGSTTTFTIPATVTSQGTTGTVTHNNSIYLNSDTFIPTNRSLVFGTDLSSSPRISSNNTTTTLTSPNFVVNGNFTVNGASTVSRSTIVTIDDPVFNVGGTSVYTVSDIMDRGVSFKYYNGGDKIGFLGRETASGCLVYIPDATETNNVYTGALGCAKFGSITADSINLQGGSVSNINTVNACNLLCTSNMLVSGTTSVSITSPTITVTGATNINGVLSVCNITCSGAMTITGTTSISLNTPNVSVQNNLSVTNGTTSLKDLSVTGNVTGIFLTQTQQKEHLSLLGNANANPGSNTNITFVKVTSAGTATGTLLPPTGLYIDGFEKKILCVSLFTGAQYRIYAPAGMLLDPDTGTTTAKYLDFENAGQSVYLIWDNTEGYYIVISASVCCYT